VEETALDLQEVWNSNQDLAERLARERLTVAYDEDFDIFTLAIGEPRAARTEEVIDGLQLRIDPMTNKLLAFEVLGFKSKYLPAHPEFLQHYRALLDEKRVQAREVLSTPEQRRCAQAAARQLLPA